MWKTLKLVNQNLIIAIPIAMLFGFLTGATTNTVILKNLIMPFTILMVYPMMVPLNVRKVFSGGDFKTQLITQAINFALLPFLAYGIGLWFFPDNPYLQLGLLLAGLLPTSGMTISWTGFANGNIEAAVKMTVVGLILGSLATPFYLQFLLGATVSVDLAAVFRQIITIVLVPMVAGFLTQYFLIKQKGQQVFRKELAPKFPLLSTIGVLGIVFIAISLKAADIIQSPGLLLKIILPILLIYGLNFFISTIIGKSLLGRSDAIALVYGTVMRNLSIALALAMNTFREAGTEAALVIAIAYIIQVQSAAWYVKFTDRIFSPAAAQTTTAID